MSAAGSLNPATGETLEAVENTAPDSVAEIVEKARQAQRDWARKSLDERAERCRSLGRRILERHLEVARIMSSETGRSETECLMNEVVGTADFVSDAIDVAGVALRPMKVKLSALNYPGKRAVIEAVPRGVIGIIAPWNYPLGNFFKHVFPALLAGNAVVMKPSEHTPRTGAWLAKQINDVVHPGIAGLALGAGDVGERLLDAGISAIAFTGSVATGRKVASAAGERLMPCTVELGGKDAAIVLADCNLERTVAGIAQWSFQNAGQDCSSIERIYVEHSIADLFTKKLAAFASKLKVAPAGDGTSDIGPLQNEAQLKIVEEQVADATSRGAKVVCGGERTGSGFGYLPTVLSGCSDDMKIMKEETFGPIACISTISDAAEGVRRANAAEYGLNASVWTANIAKGENIARQLEAGIVLVNNHSICGIIPKIPWTGVKQTGSGVANSPFAYPTYVRRRTVFVDKNKAPDPWWKPADENLRPLADALIEKGRGSFGAILKLAGLVGKRAKAIRTAVSGEEG